VTGLATGPVGGGVDVDLPGSQVRLRATRWPGTGTPVLLLHGLASTRRIWDLVVPGLAGLPVVALDARGHGESDRPAGPYDGATVVGDVLTALDALGLSRVVVVGHSWGGTVALRLAADAPERVLAVVAVDGGTDAFAQLAPTRAQVRALLTPPGLALPPEELLAMVRSGPLGAVWSPAVERSVRAVYTVGDDGLARNRLPFEAHMAVLDDLLGTDHAALWARVRCPTWLVGCAPSDGEEVLTVAKDAALARAGRVLAQPRLLRWAGAIHDVPLQWPALVAGVVRAACEETTALRGEGGSS
jgi:pimeloyl-ACP methyl ester carboxylesterase